MSVFEHLPLHEGAMPPGSEQIPAGLVAHPGQSAQPEGRGEIKLTPEHLAPSLVDHLENVDGLSVAERAVLLAAIRAYDHRPRQERTIFAQASGETDGTTGNLVLPLLTVPAGMEGHVTFVNVDAPGTAILPGAPFANAASWAYLAALSPGLALNSQALASRPGELVFAPSPASATAALVPYTWTFNDSNAPVIFGGEALVYVLVGGTQAGIAGKQIQVSYRVNLFSRQ